MASEVFRLPIPRGVYPEREDPRLSWLDEQGDRLGGLVRTRLQRRRARAEQVADRTMALAGEIEALSDVEILDAANSLRSKLRGDGLLDAHVARGFALAREVAVRHIDQRPYRVQVIGAYYLLHGIVAEMETGEGKTLTATLPASVMALAGVPVHVVTVNDYLVGRDAENMRPVYEALGLGIGMIQHGMDLPFRRAAYASDITYVSNKELTFDYLKDRLVLGRRSGRGHLMVEQLRDGKSRRDRVLMRGLCYAIVDECDSVLIDEARTPLIISGQGEQHGLEHDVYETAISLARKLKLGRDFYIDRRERYVRFTRRGEVELRRLTRNLGGIWSGHHRAEEFVNQALSALFLFEKDEHYLVEDGKVQIIDEYTGRVMEDRSWERGLHQLIEVKEGVDATRQVEPLARISYQRFFRRYLRLTGMTGTAREVRRELWSVYRLPVIRVQTNRPLKRVDMGERVFDAEGEKWDAVVSRIREMREKGRPVLVGTRSVAASEVLSRRLDVAGLTHRVLNARQDSEEADVVASAGQGHRVTVATNMAGRGTDIMLSQDAREAGGLHVIVTERHEARRIDRQLIGRCGRQGDPGSYEVVTSLEDELISAHASRLLKSGAIRSAIDRSGVDSRLRWLLMWQAQSRAERVHSRTRRQLVKTDQRVATMLAFSGRGE